VALLSALDDSKPRRWDLVSPLRRFGKVIERVVTPHKTTLANLKAIPLTLLGTASIDASAFHVNSGIGLLVTGVSLIVLEHLIADDEA
jgi:hypothetical protein